MTSEEFSDGIRLSRVEWVRRGKMVWVSETEFICDKCGRRNEKANSVLGLHVVSQVIDGTDTCSESCRCGATRLRFEHIGMAFRLTSLEDDER